MTGAWSSRARRKSAASPRKMPCSPAASMKPVLCFAAAVSPPWKNSWPRKPGPILAATSAPARTRCEASPRSASPGTDYTAAAGALDNLPARDSLPPDGQAFFPCEEVQSWLSLLAEGARREDKKAMVARCQRLIADLLGNARRSLAQGQYEDCLIRAYRILELLGQSRLFDQGYDSESMPTMSA